MSPKARPPVIRSIKKPEALSALRTWLSKLREPVREEGEAFYREGKVKRIGSDADHYVEASVQDEELHAVTLFLTRGAWSSKCNCDVRVDCKHAYAAGRAWLDTASSGGHDGADPTVISATPAPPPHPPLTRLAPIGLPKKATFASQWSPIVAQKLGRPLTEAEEQRLTDLASLFNEFVHSRGVIFPGALLRHGFEHTPPPGTPLYTPAFPGWWDRTNAPEDPWALWQFIAYDYELAGRAIPEVFRPLTDTKAISAVIHERLMQHELTTWRKALSAPSEASPATRTNPVAGLVGLRARVSSEGGLIIEQRAGPGKSWKAPTQKWFLALATARPADFEPLPPADAALADALAAELRISQGAARILPKGGLPAEIAETLFLTSAARAAIVLPDGKPFAIESAPLIPEATVSIKARDRLDLRMVTPDGRDASRARLVVLHPEPLYVFENRIWRGPPPVPTTPMPTAALGDSKIMSRLRAAGLRLPSALEGKVRHIVLRPLLKVWLTDTGSDEDSSHFHARLLAHADEPHCEQQWSGDGGWQWTKASAPPARRPEDPLLEFDTTDAQAVSERFADFRLTWDGWAEAWTRYVSKSFPDEFIAWHATLPPGLTIEASAELAGLLGPPLRARVEFSAAPAEGTQRDWFDLTVALRVEDTTLKPEEIAMLLKARGKWVRLAKQGWRRLELADDANGVPAVTALDRLGLHAEDVFTGGRTATHRLHTLQLASEAHAFAATDVNLAETLRTRAAALTALPPPPLPAGLRATLRPYQREGFHFLAHLSALGFGGVLADDMGLGKTVQALAWLLHLAENKRREPTADGSPPKPFHALIVCPKSVMHGWLTETERFAPELATTVFTPVLAVVPPSRLGVQLLVANYAQLRIQPEWFRAHVWDAIVLDEAQFVKNPSSQTAAIVRTLPTAHRLALTGTPIENRLLDLWSLFAFAQPGLLGAQASFRRQYPAEDPSATARLRRRVRHFLLRRTKAQVAPELPSRTEDEIVVDLEGPQRKLYDAELKRARAQLLGVETNRALDAVRFNVLASLLRLRQICCHPALVSDAHADLPSAKVDALLERLEELRDEGQQVLVFSQFVTLLELIRTRLEGAGITHLMLTGQTENRAELVDKFQSDKTQTVFLLSLKAAGFGLNLTAASYVILCDPWWNPAVEAQAIDRTHRIGQTQPVVAYRLVAADTVEQKILAMQREKAALAASVVQEESLASVLDLDSLRQILS